MADAAQVLRASRFLRPMSPGSRGQHRRPGAGPAASRVSPEPGAAEHLAGDGSLPSRLVAVVRWLVEVTPSERALLEGFLLDIYTARAHNDGTVAQFIEGCWPSRTNRRPRTCRPTGRLPRPRHHRAPTADHCPHTGPGRWPRLDCAPGAVPRRCRADPQGPLRGHGRGGPPALPGGPGPVERPGRRLLAGLRCGAELQPGALGCS
jgi:hypothetical protein